MSKSSVKKLLATLSAPQLAEILLDLYDARTEAKDYLDFYANPDIERRLEKSRAAISREAARQSRGRNRCRITRVRKFIKDIASLNPGDEPVCEIMTYALEQAMAACLSQIIGSTQERGFTRLLHDTVKFINASGYASQFMPRIVNAVKSHPAQRSGRLTAMLRSRLVDELERAIASTTFSHH